jgi:hypothetical protein
VFNESRARPDIVVREILHGVGGLAKAMPYDHFFGVIEHVL